ncbi:MAG: hypothetical protein IJ125_02045 [Atopobiaceae bacterium]|nr:hypothetical protein [Atopobiaceae bacterium]
MYSLDGRVRFSETTEDGNLSYLGLINYFQDCSSAHSEARGNGPEYVRQTGHAWMLASWLIEVKRLPRFNEDISVTTWPTGFKGLRAWRNFTICNASGQQLCRANSSWFMFDLHENRIMHPTEQEIDPYKDDIAEALDMPELSKRIRPYGEGRRTEPILVTHAMIDSNHHMNNAQYLSVCLAALEDEGYHVPCLPVRFELQFRKAAHRGDHIVPVVYAQETPWVVTIEDSDGAQLCALKIESIDTNEV